MVYLSVDKYCLTKRNDDNKFTLLGYFSQYSNISVINFLFTLFGHT
jgi:hypothetical protein